MPPKLAAKISDRLQDLEARVQMLEEYALPHKQLMDKFDAHMVKAHEALKATREATEGHFRTRQKATKALLDDFEGEKSKLRCAVKDCEEEIRLAKEMSNELTGSLDTLAEQLRDCQFTAAQFATKNALLALESQLVSANKRITAMERRGAAEARLSACGVESETSSRRLLAAAPVVLTRGRSVEPQRTIAQESEAPATIRERIARAQSQARTREYSRSVSQERGAFIAPDQDRSKILQALDNLGGSE
jgi:hypothetical protein